MKSKKYYTISEVTKILSVRPSQLRYLEKALSTLKVIQLKGRRYYTLANIEFIKTKINKTEIIKSSNLTPVTSSKSNDLLMVKQIDQLINKFTNVLTHIKSTITLAT